MKKELGSMLEIAEGIRKYSKDLREVFCKRCGSSKAACRCNSGGTIGATPRKGSHETICDRCGSYKSACTCTPRKRRKQRKLAQEIRMLRELAWWFFRDRKCYFCKKRFIEEKLARTLKFGRRNHKPFKQKLTQHHRDEDRQNNVDSNLKWGHQKCHKSYHMKEASKKMKYWVMTVVPPGGGVFQTKEKAATKENAKKKAESKGYKVLTIKERRKK